MMLFFMDLVFKMKAYGPFLTQEHISSSLSLWVRINAFLG